MKKLIIILTLLISESAYCIIDTIQIKTKIIDVKVFLSGAQITRHSKTKIIKGKYIIMIDKLPQEINPQSIQVKGIDHCTILSVKHQLNYENQNSSYDLDIENKIEAQKFKIKEIKNRMDVFELERKLLLDNSMISKKGEGSIISEIKEAADFYRVRLNEISQGKLNLYTELEEANKRIKELYVQLNKLAAIKRKTYSQILVTLNCEKETSADMSLSYYIPSAGWTPLYDFRVDDITKPLIIVYNAKVYQSSGEDWKDINLKLSTNNPSLTGNKPELITWHLGRRNPYQKVSVIKGPSALKGRVFDAETNEEMPFANVQIYKGGEVISGTATDFDGYYTIKPIQSGYYNVKTSYVGYEPQQINGLLLSPDKTTYQDFGLQSSGIMLDAVEIIQYSIPIISVDNRTLTSQDIRSVPTRDITSMVSSVRGGYKADGINVKGGRGSITNYHVDGMKVRGVKGSNYISSSLKTLVTNLEYVIEIPYTIQSDGEDHSIRIKEVSMPVNYVYHAVPKLENAVFLTAQIQDWTQLNLLSGKSSIYYQETYTGESFIDANQVGDTLSVSLGRDGNIIVKREGSEEMNDKRIMGSYFKEIVGWDITIRNNKNTQIRIIIEDQYPLSKKKSIAVARLESSGAKINDKTGKLTWELILDANDKKKLNYKYSVKYPKYMNLKI